MEQNNFVKTNLGKFFHNEHGNAFSTIVLGMVLLISLTFLASGKVQAQARGGSSSNSNVNVCQELGYTNSRTNLDGFWKLTFTAGVTKHETFLAIKKDAGVSITRYYDSSLKRQRRIAQIHTVCQSKKGVVILGFKPTDLDTEQTGKDLTYSADNFVISVNTDGTVDAYNLDDAGNLAEIEIEYLEELPKDVKID